MMNIYRSDKFALKFRELPDKVETEMTMLIPAVNTNKFPQTHTFLKKHAPSVLETTCYNDDNLPFDKEVRATEIGHLFEHLLLDNLCLAEVSGGKEAAEHFGNTQWNWEKDPYGVFHIRVDCQPADHKFLATAIIQTITLLEKLLNTRRV